VVEDKVIFEIKSIAEIAALHRKELLTYLRPGINFILAFLAVLCVFA
jgi:hypothetical protein